MAGFGLYGDSRFCYTVNRNALKKMEEDAAKLKALRPEEGIPGWAFRFLQTIPEVTLVLSGMSDMEQLQANIRTYETEQPLNKQELEILETIGRSQVKGVPCTGCAYCTSKCPQELNIPTLLNLYNEHVFTNGDFLAPMVVKALPEEKQPSACVGCRSCEAVCPQQIKISETMTDFAQKLQG